MISKEKDIKVNCYSCHKDIYISKSNNSCPYCKYIFTVESIDLLESNLSKEENAEQSNIKSLKVTRKSTYVRPSSVPLKCGSCGNQINISHSENNCPYCNGNFPENAINTIFNSHEKGKPILTLTPLMSNAYTKPPKNIKGKKPKPKKRLGCLWNGLIIFSFFTLFLFVYTLQLHESNKSIESDYRAESLTESIEQEKAIQESTALATSVYNEQLRQESVEYESRRVAEQAYYESSSQAESIAKAESVANEKARQESIANEQARQESLKNQYHNLTFGGTAQLVNSNGDTLTMTVNKSGYYDRYPEDYYTLPEGYYLEYVNVTITNTSTNKISLGALNFSFYDGNNEKSNLSLYKYFYEDIMPSKSVTTDIYFEVKTLGKMSFYVDEDAFWIFQTAQ